MRGASVMWLCFFIVFCEFFITCFVVDFGILVAGDLRHEFAQSAWGFMFRGPPGSWLHLSHLRWGNQYFCDGDCCHGMSIVMILTRPWWCLCCICWWGHLVAPRLIATALLIALGGCSFCECFVTSQWWRQLLPSQSMMALIVSVVIGNGVVACCCLLWLCLVPTIALCSQQAFLIV